MAAIEERRDLIRELSKFPVPHNGHGTSDFKRRTLFVIVVVAATILSIVTIWEARVILLVLFAGCLGALVLTTLTDKIRSWLHIPRVVALIVFLACLGLVVTLGSWLRGPELVEQFGKLQVDVPEATRRLNALLGESDWGRWILSHFPDSRQSQGWLPYAASGIGDAISLAISTLAGLLLAVMASIYLAVEPEFYLRGMQRVLPLSISTTVEACLTGAIRALRFWLISRVVTMTAVGVMIASGLWFLSVPLAGTLAIIAALLTFVPNIGPILSALPAALLAFAISPGKGFLTLGVFCLAHLIEGNVVTPLADRQIVKLPPFLTLSLQLLLAPIAGALGVALAAPLLAATLGMIRVLVPSAGAPDLRAKSSQTI
jgi:predicted PurR-regulated permease PerM